jgi:hypothetical protein
LDGKSRVNRVYKVAARALPVWIRLRAMAIVRVRVRTRVRARIKAILYRLKDFIGVYIGKAIRGRHRHLNNSNLNLLITLFLTRKLYTGLDITKDIII